MGIGYDRCPSCGSTCAVTNAGFLRRHPKGAETPCPGSGTAQVMISTPSKPGVPIQHVAQAGLYRSDEQMMDPGLKAPYGHATVSVVAHFPYDGTNGRTPEQEAAKLFEDPDYLSRILDAVPNHHVRILMRVEA